MSNNGLTNCREPELSASAHRRSADSVRDLLLVILPVLILFQALVWIFYVQWSLHGISDFRTWYAAAYMVRTGHGAQMYNMAKLEAVRQSILPVSQPLMQPMHLAYEAVILVPLTFVSYRVAFFVFVFVNLSVLGWCIFALRNSFPALSGFWPAVVFLAYFPITRAITQGQDSVLVLALVIAANLMLCNNSEFMAGVCLGMAFPKFQIVLPIALLFLVWKRRKVVFGFTAGAAVVLLISLAVVGLTGAREYWTIIAGMSFKLRAASDELRYAISPREMLNIRGIVAALLGSRLTHWWVQGITAALSILVFVIAARSRPSVPLAICTAAVVSYHLLAHDVSVLMIPILFCLSSRSVWVVLASMLALVLPNAGIAIQYGYVGGFGVVLLFLATWLGSGSVESRGIFITQS